MSDKIDEIIFDIPIIKHIAKFCTKIKLFKLEGLSLYDLFKMYFFGIIKGTFSTRASSIAFSFFIAIFPFLLFILNLIPFIGFIDNLEKEVLLFLENLMPGKAVPFFN